MDWQLLIVFAVVALAAAALWRSMQKRWGLTQAQGPGCTSGGSCQGCPWSCQG